MWFAADRALAAVLVLLALVVVVASSSLRQPSLQWQGAAAAPHKTGVLQLNTVAHDGRPKGDSRQFLALHAYLRPEPGRGRGRPPQSEIPRSLLRGLFAQGKQSVSSGLGVPTSYGLFQHSQPMDHWRKTAATC